MLHGTSKDFTNEPFGLPATWNSPVAHESLDRLLANEARTGCLDATPQDRNRDRSKDMALDLSAIQCLSRAITQDRRLSHCYYPANLVQHLSLRDSTVTCHQESERGERKEMTEISAHSHLLPVLFDHALDAVAGLLEDLHLRAVGEADIWESTCISIHECRESLASDPAGSTYSGGKGCRTGPSA